MSDRLEYLREQLDNESISYGELIELQGLGEEGLIPEGDVQMREAAGLPEFPPTAIKRFRVVNTWPSNVFDSGTASRAEFLNEDALVKLFGALATASNVIAIGESFLIERVEDTYEGDQT